MVVDPTVCPHSTWNLNWPGATNNPYECDGCKVRFTQDPQDPNTWHVVYVLVPNSPLSEDEKRRAAESVNAYMDSLGQPAKDFPRVPIA